MDDFSAVETARHLGISERGVRQMIARGELTAASVDPVRIGSRHVRLALALQQQEILARLARKRSSAVTLALDVRAKLHPRNPGTALPQYAEADRRRRLSLVSDDARRLFGAAALKAASEPQGSCRWCRAAELVVESPELWAPRYSGEFAALFASEPCGVCGPGLRRAVLDRLRGDVHPGGKRASAGGRVVPSAAERRLAAQWAARQPRTPAARPVQGDDDGRAMVQRRLQETRSRLKAAKRRGDEKYAIRLQQQLRSLTADAAAVDGRADAPRGRKACGVPVGVRCECHTSDRPGSR